MIYAVDYKFETRIDAQPTQSICAAAHLMLPLDSVMKGEQEKTASRDRVVHSHEFGSGEPNRLNLQRFTRGRMPFEPGDMLGLH
jgi:hypothetical protein